MRLFSISFVPFPFHYNECFFVHQFGKGGNLLAENEKLEARARASESGKIKDRMERAKLESELHDMQRLVDRIPPDILAELKRQQRQYGKER
ncbi:hypothetical protein [Clostridioides difficile]|uniref:hypothetical protein n=1 Tax=Clostridioides difficile TaxID=1496 RepID=UPI00406A95FB